jgi:hypothetical protein
MGWTAGVQFPAEVKEFSILRNILIGCGVHPASYSTGAGGSVPGDKGQGRETEHSLPTSAVFSNDAAKPSFPHAWSWRGA